MILKEFDVAKNAKIPNPFKIIPLQSTRKENSWKTEETLARAAVTLERERAKWPNP
jgi:prolyl oligopeptidase PreP (S9A serine peptidase family)